MIPSTGARLTQGEPSNGKNSSRSSSISQNPCADMFVTSACEVIVPGIAYLLCVPVHRLLDLAQVRGTEAVVSRQLDRGLKPELCLAVSRLNVDMHACLLA